MRSPACVVCALVSLAVSPRVDAFVPPGAGPADAPNIVGTYKAIGTHPDKSTYEGGATIKRVAGESYEITFHMPTGTFRAICLRERDRLSCGWGSTRDLAAVRYRPREGGAVEGVWVADELVGLGRERLGGANDTVTGLLSITEGIMPDGASYGGTLRSYLIGPVHRLEWLLADGTRRIGYGLRDGDVLVAAFNAHGTCGAAYYSIRNGGAQIVGTWMDPALPYLGIGTETLSKGS